VPSERVGRLLDTLGDGRAREILAAVSEEPQSAKELTAALDVSLPTVYRRLDDLKAAGLVSARTTVAADGNHYERYSSTFEELSVHLGEDGFAVDIQGEADVADRFSDLWEELRDDG